MTYRNRKEFSAVSEEVSHYHLPGSFLFSQPAEVNQWSLSVPFGQDLPPSPPDTASDCAPSDCQEMTSQSWIPASVADEEWTTAPAMDHSTFVPTPTQGWPAYGPSVMHQDMRAFDAATWLHAPSDMIDLGLSPVLSHESQDSHTLKSFSEPDVLALPSTPGLFFAAEPSWTPAGHVTHNVFQTTEQSMPGVYFVSAATHVPHGQYSNSHPGFAAPQTHVLSTYQPVLYAHGGHPSMQNSTLSYAPSGHMRPLLPRTEGSQPVYGPQRVLRPQIQNPQGSQMLRPVVSTRPEQVHGESVYNHVPTYDQDSVYFPVMQRVPAGIVGSDQSRVTPRPETADQSISVGPSGPIIGPVGYPLNHPEEWHEFIQYEQEDQALPQGSLSLDHDDRSVPVTASTRLMTDTRPLYPRPDSEAGPIDEGSCVTSAVGEHDEGRHRTHRLYNEGVAVNGKFHCPYEGEPSCQHKPTKLKCNYEYCSPPAEPLRCKQHILTSSRLRSKFIDSHLKPFRCKLVACEKQEFSSTACLLRHEREAHGMHGHGERPHLCEYPGCERSILGNGFPRRYNLYDHMKRVHDHKEEPTAMTGSPAGPQGQRKGGARKRRASGSLPAEPVAQRQRSMQSSQEPLKVVSSPQIEYHLGATPHPHAGPYQLSENGYPHVQPHLQALATTQRNEMANQQIRMTQHRQHAAYSQWTSQRDLLARQMDYVQSPDDEANLQQLSQNLHELRRLSDEVRRG